MANVQTAENVKILEGIAGIRAKPHMYLGDQGSQMAFRCVKEKVDNALDEATAGRNSWIEVYYNFDTGIYMVADKAGGIPIEMQALESGRKISTLTAIFTIPHSGGKFEDDAYKTSAGTHGVGVTAVNAVSEWLQVWTKRANKIYTQRFTAGRPDTPNPSTVQNFGDAASLLVSNKKDYGTVVLSKLDQCIVSESAVKGKLPRNYVAAHPDLRQLADWLKLMANLNPGLTIQLTVVRNKKQKSVQYVNNDKLEVYIKKHIASLTEDHTVYGKPLVLRDDYITLMMQWSSLSANNLQSSVNHSPTPDGGTHIRGLLDALLAAIEPYENAKHRKGRKRLYSAEDLLIGCVGFFDWRMHGAAYDSQIKTRLVSKIQDQVRDKLIPVLKTYFEQNKTVPKAMLARAIQVEESRNALSKALSASSDAKKAARGGMLPACLSTSSTKDPLRRELFLVEGDSAGGTAKHARNPEYQEVFKASGKPVNALNATLDKLLGNKVISDFLVSLGVDFRDFDEQVKARVAAPTFKVDKLRVQYVYLLADADNDGYHINSLMLAALWTVIPDLIRQGRVFVVDAPLYNVIHKGIHYGGATKKECLDKCPAGVKPKDVQRAKGWGEVPVPVMEKIGFDPKTRRVVRVVPFTSADRQSWYHRVVGDDASARRRLLGLVDD